MSVGDELEACGECARELPRRAMRQVTSSGIHLCERCYEADPLRGDDGLWIDDGDPDGDGYDSDIECPHCGGTGWVGDDVIQTECGDCGGDGVQ